ncbi:AMP-binding protein [Pseudonocardia acaciae]|uniref:AMP-binding protein n=1 Tax=Pseudonocardia acaciae TaxID=551276 RepID=UPI00048C3B0C|nr:AMP-binding protein [Pseudonocardia acaciae]
MQLSPSVHLDTFCRDRLPPSGQWPEISFDLPELRYPTTVNCAVALLEDTMGVHGPDRPCLRAPGETWTYRELSRASNRVARVLTEDFGLVAGNRVLLRGPNNPWLVAAWFGVLKAGGVVVTTMPLLRRNEIAVIAEATDPVLAICDERFAEELDAVERTTMATVLYGGSDPDDLVNLCAGKDGEFDAVATAADDVAMLAPTSGTTGTPKITMHFHRDVLAIADTFGKYVVKGNADDVFTGTPPIGFTFGLGGLVVFPLRCGASTLLLERASPTELADAIAEHGVTVLSTAPTAYKAMLAAGKAKELTGLRRCVSAGEHLPKAVWEDFRRQTGVRIIDGIGGTEMLHVFISAADGDIRPGSTGIAVPGYRAAILDHDGNELPDGTPGRLAVRGPTGCRYLDDERQLVYVDGGWNITGDTYVRDADGYFWYQARSDDMIISSGYNIAGPEVEEALLGHPDVAEAAVVGAPDEERGMIVKAFVVLADAASPDPAKAAELQSFCKQAIAPYKYPREIEFIDALPRTSNGKVMRYVLRRRPRAVTHPPVA